MPRFTPFLGIGAAIALAGCASNSDGRYAASAIEPGSPLAQYMLALDAASDPIAEEQDVDLPALEHEAVLQLEDLVEGAASRLAGTPFDYPTPDLGDIDFAAEVALRTDAEDYIEWFYPALYDGDVGYGVKYLLDHAGKEHSAAALDHPEAKDLAMAVDGYVLDVTPEKDSIELLREVEQRIRISLGLSEDEWFGNERVYDSAVDTLGAYSEPAYGCPLFRRCRVEIPRSMFRSSILEIVHTYGHELMHCRVGDFESKGEQHRTIEETACEVFGARIVDQLVAMQHLDFGVDERIFGPREEEPVIDFPPLTDDSGGAPEQLDYAEVEAEFARLLHLYRASDITFERWRRTQARYGYVEVDPKPAPSADDADVYSQLAEIFDRFGVDSVAALIPELANLPALRSVVARSRDERATLVQLIDAARASRRSTPPRVDETVSSPAP